MTELSIQQIKRLVEHVVRHRPDIDRDAALSLVLDNASVVRADDAGHWILRTPAGEEIPIPLPKMFGG
jgi:hypothetical protein